MSATTDLETLKNLFTQRNIAFEHLQEPGDYGSNDPAEIEPHDNYKYAQSLKLKTYSENVIGYGGFLCEFFFDEAGKLLFTGCWEE